MDEAIKARFAAINPLGTLGAQQITDLLANARVITARRKDVIFHEGDEDNDAVYLIAGTIHTASTGGRERVIETGSDASNYALGNLRPRPFSAFVASDEAVVVRIERTLVENLTARSQMVTGQQQAVTVTDISGESAIDGAWMFQLLQSALFRDLPTEHIEQFFGAIERMEYGPRQHVILQGEPGDYFYMIAEGECEVMRNVSGLEFPIATLTAGESFGEEALISGMPRNATVRTRDNAVLMRLRKEPFEALLKQPTVRSLSASEAAPLIRQEACTVLDVRMESEHGARAIRNSVNIPLYRVRSDYTSLDQSKPVLAFCDTGERSKVAAFLLCQRGLDASYLEGGLSALSGG